MDEFKQSRALRRLALLVAISCLAADVDADEQGTRPTSTFRSLIAQGWKNDAQPPVASSAEPLAELIRKQAVLIEVPRIKPALKQEPIQASESALAPEPVQELLPEPIVAPQPTPIAALSTEPSVQADRQSLVPVQPEPIAEGQPQLIAEAQPELIVQRQPKSILDLQPELIAELPPQSIAEAQRELIQQPESTSEAASNEPLVATEPEELPVAMFKPISEQSALETQQNGFELFPLADIQADAAIESEPSGPAFSPVANAQAIRLHEAARMSLRSAGQRLRHRATHSAKMYALETLRSIVAMQDAKQGGNTHAKMLDAALDAIRESRDFCGSFGAVDYKALQRMVAVHETPALKGRNLESLSAIEATEEYLNFAKQNLVVAAGGAREASDALVILGNVERETVALDNAYASAVAVMLQQTAVEIAPQSMTAHCELGITLSHQGLIDQAAASLKQSLSIQPTRRGYAELLEVSRRSGDIDTAHACVTARAVITCPTRFPCEPYHRHNSRLRIDRIWQRCRPRRPKRPRQRRIALPPTHNQSASASDP